MKEHGASGGRTGPPDALVYLKGETQGPISVGRIGSMGDRRGPSQPLMLHPHVALARVIMQAQYGGLQE